MKLFPFPLIPALIVLTSQPLAAGVRKEVETRYSQEYVNRALTLRQPVRGLDQAILVGQPGGRLDPSTLGARLMFRVGDQVRITKVDFRDQEVRFDIESPDRATAARVTFRFTSELTHSFPQQSDFDSALAGTFTEALSYRDVDGAKADYIKAEFDEMVRRFVGTTATSTEFVMQSLAALNPEYKKAVDGAEAERRRAERLQSDLEEARETGRAARQEIEQARQAAATAGGRLDGLQEENQQLRDRSASLQQDVSRLGESNSEYQQQIERLERQINAVADKLDLELASTGDLGERVEDLTESLDSLQQERGSLSDQLSRVHVQLGQLQEDKATLTAELESSQTSHRRLQRNYNRLTGDKNSVAARLAETTEERDHLQAVDELEGAFELDIRTEQHSEGAYEVAALRLGDHALGVVEILPPLRAGDTSVVVVKLDSPETVAFSERERELYESLGEQWQVKASWVSEDESIEVQPREGEMIQQLAQRESVQWRWQLAGSPVEPVRVALNLSLINSNDLEVDVLQRQFLVRPAGLGVWLWETLSWFPLAMGGLLGATAMALVGRSRNRRTPAVRGRTSSSGEVRKGL